MNRRKGVPALLAGLMLLAGSFAGTALAFDSGGTPSGLGSDTITWTGQGATGGVLDTQECPSPDTVPDGIDANSYLHWIFTTDGGSADNAVLTLGGTGSGTYAGTNTGGAWHFFTPYFVPISSLTAHVDFDVLDTGDGAWNLTISHGCPGDGHPQGDPLGVSKTADGSFTRSYTWAISKDVDKTRVEQIGGSATFNYTVNAWQTGFSDSDWAVGGTITVTNANAFDVPATVSDALAGATCTVADTSVTVPANGSVDIDYGCTFSAAPSGTLTNTATVSWGDVETLPAGSADFALDFGFPTDPTTTANKTITVTDTYAGALGTLTATDSAPFASASYNYSRTISIPTFDCASYDNTATITETGQSAGQTVTVCGPARTGALTMGFWQNKNGQGIIKAGSSTAGVCNSGTWLRTYAPFQDLSATATCTQVAAYVTNLIKAANASGASMNAMLKAQMLATALDVYFSDPALGGNQIGAPAPIGGFSVDLTMICTDLSCTAFEDSSSAFGGSPKTVLQMLAYAASQSNVGGTTWYANVKATQELAKDAFDALNNQKVFAG